jgi:hypothetical protein
MTPRALARIRWSAFIAGCLLGLAFWCHLVCLIADRWLAAFPGR